MARRISTVTGSILVDPRNADDTRADRDLDSPLVASPRRTEKVVCYLVRDCRLLVFRHVDWPWEEVGIQVPAGTIEPGESPETAAVRETREETGLDRVTVVRKLGESEYDVRPYRDEVHHRHFFLLRVEGEVADRWASGEASPPTAARERFECFWIPLENGHVLQSVRARSRPPPR